MVVLTDAEAIIMHDLLMNMARDCHIVGLHEKRLREIADRLKPSKDLPEPNRASHQS